MQRDPSLTAFSREHHFALKTARRLRACAQAGAPWLERHWPAIRSALGAYWREGLRPHFAAEEREFAWCRLQRSWEVDLRRDHRDIEALFERARVSDTPPVELLEALASRLKAHVRWEETKLFPAIERTGPGSADSLRHEETRARPGWSMPTPADAPTIPCSAGGPAEPGPGG